jgi:hypothetical protein
MSEMLRLATAALLEAGHGDQVERLIEHPIYGVSIKTPCEKPHIVIKAVALAHQAAGHNVTVYYVDKGAEGKAASFDCEECGLEGKQRE